MRPCSRPAKRPTYQAMASLRKRSVQLSGHATSIALEPEFWAVLEAMAAAERLSLAALIGRHRRRARRPAPGLGLPRGGVGVRAEPTLTATAANDAPHLPHAESAEAPGQPTDQQAAQDADGDDPPAEAVRGRPDWGKPRQGTWSGRTSDPASTTGRRDPAGMASPPR